eukprot:612253-Pleurochrysis_carterae.AAC.1
MHRHAVLPGRALRPQGSPTAFFALIDKPHCRGEYDYEALCKSLVERADAFFLAAQASNQKWNAT